MDALHHGDLTSSETVTAIPAIAAALDAACEGERPIAVLAALTTYFVTICRYLDIDPIDAFEQISDAIDAGELNPDTDVVPDCVKH